MASSERDRLNRRIRDLCKDKARSLKSYRQFISRQSNVRRRQVAMAFVPREGKPGFFEAVDVIPLCHQFLDKLDVPKHDDEPDRHNRSRRAH